MTVDRSEIEATLGYAFERQTLLAEALTHRSHAHEQGGPDNERLEFLGDSLVNFVASQALVERFPEADEGLLSRLRARLVNTESLAALARELGVGPHLLLGRGEERTGGRDRTSVLADAMEALCGAVLIEAGAERAHVTVRRLFESRLAALDRPDAALDKDPRSRLQETTQRKWRTAPSYAVSHRDGPDHAPSFEVVIQLGERQLGKGTGKNKREASMSAALDALATLEREGV